MTDSPEPPKRKAPPPRPTPTSTGGRTALTPAISAAIAAHVADGMPFAYAVEAEGFHRSMGAEWLKRAEADEQPFADFAAEIRRARARYVGERIRNVKDGTYLNGTEDWHAADRALVIADPETFGSKVEVTVKAREQAQDDLLDRLRAGLDSETYGRVLAVLMGGSGSPSADAVGRRDH